MINIYRPKDYRYRVAIGIQYTHKSNNSNRYVELSVSVFPRLSYWWRPTTDVSAPTPDGATELWILHVSNKNYVKDGLSTKWTTSL